MASSIDYNGGLTASLEVSDLDKAINWYQDMLGFKLQYRLDEMGWAEMETGVKKVNLGLSVVETPKVEGGSTLTFGVNDIDSARRQLEEKDVRFDGDTITIPDMVRLATFFDPDGNKLMFYQDLQKK